ncbi:phosphatase PAP2 family protein [Flavobacteriaceae bacterium TP-CH-4]|uniref:Phosphatase PAP2 family protein n=1 Tax=Pelagihabitans pacificus TaxID=2696054 RepID=A0A967AV78_9FLAO|nr:phosphatase PAP2 family protein [Pelagihabitans pacificus]NHF60594.1 phosphatase PAP2 family protein [Pelagihabitans pacificus]
MKFFIYVVCLSTIFSLQSQDFEIDSTGTRWQMAKYDFGNVFKGIGYAYSRPFHWRGPQWKDAGITALAFGASYLVDNPVNDYMGGIRDDVPQFIRDYGFEYGSPSNNYILTGAIYLTGLAIKDEKLRRTGVLLISSASAAGLLQQFLKSAVGRARPLSGYSKDTFDPLWGGDRDFHSFPSGHAILAMTNAHAIAKQFKNKWVKGGIYTLGAIPAISRLWEGKHWLSDVTLSVFISIFTVEAIDRYLDTKYDKKYNDKAKKISYDLSFGPGQVGLVMRF